MNLLDGNSDDEVKFSISKDYAKRYDKWRQGEELERLKNKYGKDVNLESSSSSEDEDEDARELTKDVEKQFFKTLSCLKEKNPKIYDSNVRFFDKKSENDESQESMKTKKEKEPSLTIAEYTRKQLLEKGGHISDEEEKPLEEMTHVEQEQALKESFKDVLKDSDDEQEGDEWGGIFKKRVKTAEEIKQEEDDFREWLAGQKESIENEEFEKDLKGLHDYWTDPKLDEKEAFLKDYILNKRYLEKEDEDRIPSYDEIVHESDESSDEFDKQQQQFEHKYNFRYEEPDQEFIKRYPRIMEQSMRKKDDKRKRHRDEVKLRKEAERAKKDEELKRLKTLKRKEIMDKIKQLQEITGNEEMPFDPNDVEGDFDPEEHDKRMSQLFNDDYYTVGDEQKPEFPALDEELEIENWDEWDGKEKGPYNDNSQEELHCEDPNFVMDCDYDPDKHKKLQEEIIETTKGRRKRRRQSRFAAALAKPKPIFDPNDKTFEKYIDEYYSLDYEDLIGDIPCRFKYRKVVPNDYGLTVEEILAAPDRELNAWASLKKIVRRRPEHIERNEVNIYKKKANNIHIKKKILPTVYADPSEEKEENKDAESPVDNKKKKRKISENDAVQPEEKLVQNIEEGSKKKRKKKNKQHSEVAVHEEEVKKGNLEEEKIETEKKKKKKKKKGIPESIEANLEVADNAADDSFSRKEKKKKNKMGNEAVSLNDANNSVEESIPNKKKRKSSETIAETSGEDFISIVSKKKKRKHENGVDAEQTEDFKKKGKNNVDQKENNSQEKNKWQNNSNKFKNKQKNSQPDNNWQNNSNKFKNNKFNKNSEPKNNQNNSTLNLSDERLRSYGINPKKFKNRKRYFN